MVCTGINFIYTYSFSLWTPCLWAYSKEHWRVWSHTLPVLLIYLYKLVGRSWIDSLDSEFESLLLTPTGVKSCGIP